MPERFRQQLFRETLHESLRLSVQALHWMRVKEISYGKRK